MAENKNNNNNNKQPLRELLKEDQEPFFLKDYIAERRSQLVMKRSASVPKTHLQVKKIRKPTNMTKTKLLSPSPPPSKQQNFPVKFCRNACFFSSSSTPDVRKSPLFEFPSPSVSKSQCMNSPILLHIPARTAAFLLEAALRIQKQSNSNNKAKTQMKTSQGFGIFGSFLKRLAHRSGNRKREFLDSIAKEKALQNLVGDKSTSAGSSSSSSSSSSSKCLDLETSSSSSTSTSTSHTVEMEFVMRKVMTREDDHDFCDDDDEEEKNIIDEFCDQSPFHFVLQRSPSSGHRTPEFSSPATSPFRLKQVEKENYVAESSEEFQIEEEEEEKEQFSPVSVLDPPFEDDYDGCHDDVEDEDVFDLDSSYAIVQRTKNQLLQKLRRFEKLAELDPIELEKRMLDDNDDADDSHHFGDLEEEEECDDFEPNALDREASTHDSFIQGVLSKPSFYRTHHALEHMKRLVSDLIVEESREQNHIEKIREEEIVKRVCKRFESWKEVQSNTIDMMVEQDFWKELEGWKDNKVQIGETAMEIELAICGLLVEELAEELVC